MPRFHFHLHNDLEVPDPDGIELPSLEAALVAAVRYARFTAAETIKDTGRMVCNHRIDIEDENGVVLDTVYFGDAVKIEG